MISFWLVAGAALLAPPSTVPKVVVDGEAEAPPREDPTTSGAVLRPAELPGVGRTVGDLVQLAPGVQVRRDGGPGSRETVLLRGTDGQQTLVLLDGVRLNPAFGGGVDLSTIPLAAVERVEVTLGGGGALFGADAIGGAVSLVPRLAPLGTTAEAAAGVGSFGTWEGSGSLGYGAATGGGLVVYRHRRSDGDFAFVDANGAARVREHAGTRSDAAIATAGARLGARTELLFTGELSRTDRDLPGVEQFPSDSARFEGLDALTSLRLRRRDLGVRGLDLEARVAWVLHQAHFVDPSPLLPPPADSLASVHEFDATVGTTWWAPGGHRVRLDGCVRVDRASVERTGASDLVPERVTGSVLAADEWALGPVTLQGALRIDASDLHGAAVVPRVGATWEGPHITVRAGAGRSYRAPSFDELYFDTGFVKGDPDLSPEDAWSFDGGVTLAAGKASLDVSAFHQRIENLILFLPQTAFTVVADDSQGARSTGVESRLRFGRLGPLSLEARYTFVDARFRDSGRRLPGRAQHLYGGRITATHGAFTLWVEALGTGPFYLDRFEGLEEEGRVLVSAGWRADIGPHASVSLDARNLGNVRTAIDALQQPLPGFALDGSARFTF